MDGPATRGFTGRRGQDGKIVRVGRFEQAETKHVIDAKGQIVHRFYRRYAHTEDIFNNPTAENFVRMGVTSLITGNCGGSTTDVGEFLGRFQTKPLAVNLGTLIAHGSVRSKVMGLDNRDPTTDEQAKMNEMVEQGMTDGAVGLSTGLIYVRHFLENRRRSACTGRLEIGGPTPVKIPHTRHRVVKCAEAINIGKQANMP